MEKGVHEAGVPGLFASVLLSGGLGEMLDGFTLPGWDPITVTPAAKSHGIPGVSHPTCRALASLGALGAELAPCRILGDTNIRALGRGLFSLFLLTG